MEAGFRVLGTAIRLSGPAEIVGPIVSAYDRFRVAEPIERPIPILYEPDPRPVWRVGDRPIPVVEGIDPTLQLYHHFLQTLFDRIDSHAMIHGAALIDRAGRAFVLAGPSGHGKSSLALELARRGRGFLTDDYAPFDLAEGSVSPYPRALGILPDGLATIPKSVRALARQPGTPRLFGKALIDPVVVLGENRVVREPAALRRVILLDASPKVPAPVRDRIQIVVLTESVERVEAELAAIPGMEISRSAVAGPTRSIELHLPAGVPLSRRLAAILADEAIILSLQLSGSRPGFAATPKLTPIKRREAAMEICREMLNRREGGRLLSRFDDDPCVLLLELSAALRHVECLRLRVGGFPETVALLEELTSN